MSAGFAVALSGVAAAGALVGSLAAGSFLHRGSSSRVLRASFLFRAVAAACCVAAIPANPLAPAFLLVGSALFNGAGNAGALATNERLYRLAPAQARVHCQSRFVGATGAAAGAGALVCATALALAPPAAWAAYTALYAGSAISRTIAMFRTEVSASWTSPSAPPPRPPFRAAAQASEAVSVFSPPSHERVMVRARPSGVTQRFQEAPGQPEVLDNPLAPASSAVERGGRGMVGGNHGNQIVEMPGTAAGPNLRSGAQKAYDGRDTEGDDHTRADQRDLGLQILPARRDLAGSGRPVGRRLPFMARDRTAFDDVGDVRSLPVQPDCSSSASSDLPAAPTNGSPGRLPPRRDPRPRASSRPGCRGSHSRPRRRPCSGSARADSAGSPPPPVE